MFFAELDENGKVKAVLSTWKKPDKGTFVELESYDASIIGGTYDSKTKTFIPSDEESFKQEEDLLTIVKRIESDLNTVKNDVLSLKSAK